MKIVIGTMNPGKVNELKKVFSNIENFEIIGLSDLNITDDAPETSNTFVGNALQKATFYAKLTNLPCISDDSGLEVEKLNNMPGVFSARWTGVHADDKTNNEMLVRELKRIGVSESPARYVSAMAIVMPSGKSFSTVAYLNGTIKNVPQGNHGFSYDPYFYISDNMTIADLSTEEKNKISHRGKAARQLAEIIGNNPHMLEENS